MEDRSRRKILFPEVTDEQWNDWKWQVKNRIETLDQLKKYIKLTPEEEEGVRKTLSTLRMAITPYYLSLIDPDDPHCPIRRQAIPTAAETFRAPEDLLDPLHEDEDSPTPGLTHRYPDRVLMLITDMCSMYCRHCFRKRMVGLSSEETAKHIPEMAEYVRNHPEIDNVLISGGDAFMNSDAVIRQYLEAFTAIPSIKLIRFGTRTPVTFPYRITEDDGELEALLKEFSEKKAIMIVTHYNHPLELTDESRKAIRILQRAGCIVRNQTVLLHGVNDDPATLSDLMSSLVSINIEPYYVFQCRPVEGVKNQFQVPILRGSRIIDLAKASMSGPAKAFRYAMSHPTGKIEILGQYGDRMLFRYHQAKYDKDQARIFTRALSETECWFDDPDME